MTDQSHAWLMVPLGMRPVIVAQHVVQQYLTDFRLLAVPFTPAHCSTAIIWQERIVPVLNLGGLLGESYHSDFKLAVLAYQQESLAPLHYVALAVTEAPERISVTDDDMCDAPVEDTELWSILAQTWIDRAGQPTPIMSTAALDSVDFCRYAGRVFAALAPAIQVTWRQSATTAAVSSPSEPAVLAHDANPGAVMAAVGSNAAMMTSTNAKPAGADSGFVSTESRLAQTASKSVAGEDGRALFGVAGLDDEEDIDSWDEDDLDEDDLEDDLDEDDLDDDDLDDDDLDDDDLDDDDLDDDDLDEDDLEDDLDEDDLDEDDLDEDDLDEDDLEDDLDEDDLEDDLDEDDLDEDDLDEDDLDEDDLDEDDLDEDDLDEDDLDEDDLDEDDLDEDDLDEDDLDEDDLEDDLDEDDLDDLDDDDLDDEFTKER